MTAPALDTRDHASAIKTALGTALGQWDAYDYGDLGEDNLPSIFALISVERRTAPLDRPGRSGRSGWRLGVRYVGRSIAEARWAEARVNAALDGLVLSVDGATSTPVAHESTTAVAPDEGRFSGVSSFTYVL